MSSSLRFALVLTAAALVGACDPSSHNERSADAEAGRGELGKADVAGTCQLPKGRDRCGRKGVGNCWCDDACLDYGDCCSDAAVVCGIDEPACEPLTCKLDCPFGLATDDDGCSVCSCATQFCGGIAGFPCPDGFTCVDVPDDDCAPPTGADCSGMCVPTAKQCTTADCGPAPGAPNFLCPDGTVGGPSCGLHDDGTCGWSFVSCPDTPAPCGDQQCTADEVCVTLVTQLGLMPACQAIAPTCAGTASCGCMGDVACTGAFSLCNDAPEGGLSCTCPVC